MRFLTVSASIKRTLVTFVCALLGLASPIAHAQATPMFSVPTFLKNFEFDANDWRKSPALDRAIIGAYRVERSRTVTTLEDREQLRAKVSVEFGVNVESLKVAVAMLQRTPLTVNQIRNLSIHLRFRAIDILRLENSLVLSTANAAYSQDSSLFAEDEWRDLFARINGERRGLPLKNRIENLTEPMAFRGQSASLKDVSEYLNLDQKEFKLRFDEVQKLRSQLSPDEQERIVDIMSASVRDFFTRGINYEPRKYNPFVDSGAAELVSFVMKHSKPNDRLSFAFEFIGKIMSAFQSFDLPIDIKVAQAILGANRELIESNRDIAEHLFNLLVRDVKYEQGMGFEFIDELYETWQKGGFFNDRTNQVKMATRFAEIFSRTAKGENSNLWVQIDWLKRLEHYEALLDVQSRDMALSRVFKEKFVVIPEHPTVRAATEVQLLKWLNWLVSRPGLSISSIQIRLNQVMRVYLPTVSYSSEAYPAFEVRLAELLKLNNDSNASLVEKISITLDTIQSMSHGVNISRFLNEIKSLFTNTGTAKSRRIEQYYTDYLADFLTGVLITDVEAQHQQRPMTPQERENLTYVPVTVKNDALARAYYVDFKLRVGPARLHALVDDVVRTGRRRGQTESGFYKLVKRDYDHFKGVIPESNTARQFIPSIVSCASFLEN